MRDLRFVARLMQAMSRPFSRALRLEGTCFSRAVVKYVFPAKIPHIMKLSAFLAFCLMLAAGLRADGPSEADLRAAVQKGPALLSQGLENQMTDAFLIAQQIGLAYEAHQTNGTKLSDMLLPELQMYVRKHTNDLAPRLLLLARPELIDDFDCDRWFRNLKITYTLCTNDEQRVACLVIPALTLLDLEKRTYGRQMLVDFKNWLHEISEPPPSAVVRDKINYLNLFVSLGLREYEEVSRYAVGTPFRAITPLWMMSKGKWELALQEVIKLRKLPDLKENEVQMLDGFEPILRGVTEKKGGK